MKNKNAGYLSSISAIVELFSTLSKKIKKRIIYTFLLMLVSSCAEILVIGSLYPFLTLISKSDSNNAELFFDKFINTINNSDLDNITFYTYFFIIAIVLATLLRIFNIKLNTRLSANIASEISVSAFGALLSQPYDFFIFTKSSSVISICSVYITYITQISRMILQFLTSFILSFAIILSLFLINFKVAILLFFSFSIVYFIQIIITKKILTRNSKNIAIQGKQHVKIIQEGIASIRDIILGDYQEKFINRFKNIDQSMRILETNNNFISILPRYLTEGFGLILIAVVVSYLNSENNSKNVISTVGTLTLGLQRLLPLLFQMFSAWSLFRSYIFCIYDVLDLIKIRNKRNKQMSKLTKTFSEIELKNIDYKYGKENPYIFKDLNLYIKRGELVGIIGETGSGKSTLMDLLMGLIIPSKGKINVDSISIHSNKKSLREWMSQIAHVPQDIFLLDASIAENIAFCANKENIDYKKLNRVLEKCKLSKLVSELKYGYGTIVGERGINLSGGQKQRIGIARALYAEKKVIFFDEATSALDIKTENEIINTLENLDKNITLFFITHRQSSLKFCNKILEVKNSKVYEKNK